jgi:hypothetical protein
MTHQTGQDSGSAPASPDARLAGFSDNDLRREIRLREQERTRAFLDSLGPCEVCGARIEGVETNVVETFKSAPKWQGWPLPPPPEYEQIDGHRYESKLICDNGHETWREEIRFKDTVTA